jgi:thioredoxin-related protein
MKKWNFLFFVLIFLPVLLSAQDGIHFFKGSWAEALEEASKQEKIIFVDAFTTWCGPCKRMSRNVFPDPDVGTFYNANFINMKLDMEKGEGLQFRKKYPVSAFPTLFFIDGEGGIVLQTKGARDVPGFLELGKKALSKIDYTGQYIERYEEGDRSPELVYNYIKALNKSGKPSLKVANDYIDKQEKLNTEQNLRIIFEGTTEADSRIFGLLIRHRKEIESLESSEAVVDRIELACRNTLNKALEFKLDMLLEEAVSKMEEHAPERAEAFTYEAKKQYYATTGNTKDYLKTVKGYASKVIGNDASQLHSLAEHISQNFPEEDKLMKLAEKYAEKAASYGGLFQYYITYSGILLKNGKKAEAIKAAEKAKELAGDNKSDASRAIYFIKQMESME